MNDYEKERLANIAANEELLKQIGLTGIKPPKPRPPTPSKKLTPRKRESEEPVARRTSSRLSGIPADSEIAKRKAQEQELVRSQQDRQKRLRVEGPIDLKEVIENDATWEEAQKTLGAFSEGFVREHLSTMQHTETKDDSEDELTKLHTQVGSLSLLEKWEPNDIKITPERVFSMGMHPGTKKLAVAGDKAGHLGLWDVENFKTTTVATGDDEEDYEREDPVIYHFKLHSRTITSFSIDAGNSSQLYSGSYDGSVRRLDLVTGKSTELFASTSDQAVTSIEIQPDGNLLYFSTLNGEVGVKDPRSKQDDCDVYQLHDRKIGALGLYPSQPHIICTSSLDRTMKVWDFKNMAGTRKQRLPTLRAEYLCNLSVSSAFMNANGSIVATSFDDTLKIFDISKISTWPGGIANQIEPDVSIKHNNQTGRWLTVFKAAWQKNPADGVQKFVVGNMRRQVNIYDEKGNVLADLENEYISAVPAVVAMHPSENWVIAGNASGKALFFS